MCPKLMCRELRCCGFTGEGQFNHKSNCSRAGAGESVVSRFHSPRRNQQRSLIVMKLTTFIRADLRIRGLVTFKSYTTSTPSSIPPLTTGSIRLKLGMHICANKIMNVPISTRPLLTCACAYAPSMIIFFRKIQGCATIA